MSKQMKVVMVREGDKIKIEIFIPDFFESHHDIVWQLVGEWEASSEEEAFAYISKHMKG